MTFLELCAALHREAGISGTAPSSVVSQVGEANRLVNWVADAWSDIQMSRTDWTFMRGTFTFQTEQGKYSYTTLECNIPTVGRFRNFDYNKMRIYQNTLGVSDQTKLNPSFYEDYLDEYLTGQQVQSRPICFAVQPENKNLLLGYIPNTVYTVTGEYHKKPQVLAAHDDVPDIPSEYHMMIVWEALKSYANFESAPEVLGQAEKKLKPYKSAMIQDFLPQVKLGRSMV